MTKSQQQRYPEERRWATVLFADVQGYTRLSEQLDFESLSDLIKEVWQRLDDVIRKFDGVVDKHLGDGVMAVWGAPYAGESDAERAVSAGLALLDSIKLYAQESNRPGAQDLVLRIGINTGPVLAGYIGASNEYTVIGDTVNIANRLEQLAEPGTLLISESTHRLVRGEFKVRSLGQITLRGKTSPISAYIVDRKREQTSTIRYRSEEVFDTHMVGRDYELQKLSVIYNRAMRFHKPTLVLVTGDAGIGKSRLLMEFTSHLDDSEPNLTLMSTRALDQTSRDSFFLWKALWQNRFSITDIDPPEIAKDKFEAGIRKLWEVKLDGRSPSEAIHLIGNLMGLTWSSSRYLAEDQDHPEILVKKAFELTRDLLQRTSKTGPIVLLMDDLHWADNLSLELLDYLLKPSPEPLPLLILTAARKEFLRSKPRWANVADVITLEALPVTAEIVRMAYPDLTDLPEEVMAELARRSDGNPYFLEEMVKELVKSGIIKGGSTPQEMVEHIRGRIPETLQAMLQARIDSLTREARMVALMASVVGRVFWVGPLLAAARSASNTGTGLLKLNNQMIDRVVQDGLRKLIQAEMAFPRAGSRYSEDQEYIFKHSILRDVAYGLIPRKYLPQYHLAVARRLIIRPDSKYKVMAAYHFDKAGALYEASRYYENSARDAHARGAIDEAEWLLSRARSLKEKLRNLSSLDDGQ
jgi:class 3 adenylate cyclase